MRWSVDLMSDIEVNIDNHMLSENGWIAPNGDFYTCGPLQHDDLAAKMANNPNGVRIIEKTHIRISRNMLSICVRSSIIPFDGHLTQNQRTAIWDWCDKHGEDCPLWVMDYV